KSFNGFTGKLSRCSSASRAPGLKEKPRSDDDSAASTSRAKSTIKAFRDLLKCRTDAGVLWAYRQHSIRLVKILRSNPGERIGPPEGIRQRGVQFGMHWRKNGEARRKTPRVEPTMKGQEGSGTLPRCILPGTTMTTTTTMDNAPARVCKVDSQPICLLDSGAPLSSTRTNGAGRYTYDRRFYLLFRRQFEYALPSTGVLLRRFTLRPPGTFFSTKIEKLRGPAFAMTLSRDEQLNGFPEGSHGKEEKVANVRKFHHRKYARNYP
ncbi:hypothetical protein DBV15_00572, partial [Temnothorax longispinosus]